MILAPAILIENLLLLTARAIKTSFSDMLRKLSSSILTAHRSIPLIFIPGPGFSGAGERSFRYYLDLVVFADGVVRFWFCWFCTHFGCLYFTSICVRARGSPEPYLFAEASTLEKHRFFCVGYGWPLGGIKVNFGVSDAIEIGDWTQFM